MMRAWMWPALLVLATFVFACGGAADSDDDDDTVGGDDDDNDDNDDNDTADDGDDDDDDDDDDDNDDDDSTPSEECQAEGVWLGETISEGIVAGDDIELELDGQTRPHVLYGTRGADAALIYAFRDEAWNYETVVDYSERPSLVVSDTGELDLLRNETLYAVHAQWEGAQWSERIVLFGNPAISRLAAGQSGSLFTVDAQGTLAGTFITAHEFVDGVWQETYRIPTQPYLVDFTQDVAVDSGNRPHLIYNNSFMYVFDFFSYATAVGDEWESDLIDTELIPRYSSLTLSVDDEPFVAYARSYGPVRIAHRNGGDWLKEDLSGPQAIQGLALRLDVCGNLHLAYVQEEEPHVYYATERTGERVYTAIEETDGYPLGVALELDAQGRPHVAYVTNGGVVRYVVFAAEFGAR